MYERIRTQTWTLTQTGMGVYAAGRFVHAKRAFAFRRTYTDADADGHAFRCRRAYVRVGQHTWTKAQTGMD
eukprot:3813227-Lingulodinium_polyedra.AAC.1